MIFDVLTKHGYSLALVLLARLCGVFGYLYVIDVGIGMIFLDS